MLNWTVNLNTVNSKIHLIQSFLDKFNSKYLLFEYLMWLNSKYILIRTGKSNYLFIQTLWITINIVNRSHVWHVRQ